MEEYIYISTEINTEVVYLIKQRNTQHLNQIKRHSIRAITKVLKNSPEDLEFYIKWLIKHKGTISHITFLFPFNGIKNNKTFDIYKKYNIYPEKIDTMSPYQIYYLYTLDMINTSQLDKFISIFIDYPLLHYDNTKIKNSILNILKAYIDISDDILKIIAGYIYPIYHKKYCIFIISHIINKHYTRLPEWVNKQIFTLYIYKKIINKLSMCIYADVINLEDILKFPLVSKYIKPRYCYEMTCNTNFEYKTHDLSPV